MSLQPSSSSWPLHWPHFNRHPYWVSPFDSNNLNEFYDQYQLKHMNAVRGLGQKRLTAEGGFNWKCNVSGYLPNELKIELDGDHLLIAAEHSESSDDETVTRSLKRRVTLPKDVHKESIKCHIDGHGWLEIHAERAHPAGEGAEKVHIPIAFCLTGVPIHP